mgnify:CR=1 FL=1
MTAQMAEILYYEGDKISMCSNPLSQYFSMAGVESTFESNCTALWRGYIGTWEIVEERLYLTVLKGILNNGDEACLSSVFPDFPDRVFAHWYSGTIRITQGRLLEYRHAGYASTYERDLFFDIEKGLVTETRVQENGVTEEGGSSEEYSVAAMTIFSNGEQEEGGEH